MELDFFCSFQLFVFVSFQLQKRNDREEQLGDVIKAYEKIHLEKNNLQRDLDKMVRENEQLHSFFSVVSG